MPSLEPFREFLLKLKSNAEANRDASTSDEAHVFWKGYLAAANIIFSYLETNYKDRWK